MTFLNNIRVHYSWIKVHMIGSGITARIERGGGVVGSRPRVPEIVDRSDYRPNRHLIFLYWSTSVGALKLVLEHILTSLKTLVRPMDQV
jgi:hypothetical protein